MPRVNTQTKSTRGREISCGRVGCGRKIEPGERYHSWKFRYGGPRYRCSDHYPRPSELTQSKMATVYAEIEAAEDALPMTESVEEIRELVEHVAESVREVAEEYREAAEPFQGQGENAERADELEGWADELESFDPSEDEVSDGEDSLEGPRSDAQDVLNGCPL